MLASASAAVLLSAGGCLTVAGDEADRRLTESEDSHREPRQTVEYSVDAPTTEATVSMIGTHENRFSPQLVWIEAGGTVSWHNADPDHDHDVALIADRTPADATLLSSGLLALGESIDRTFVEPGVYDYVCTPHASRMVGRIIVGQPDPSDERSLSAGTDTLAGEEAAAVFATLDERTMRLLDAADCDCPE